MGIYDDELDPGSTLTPTTVTTPSVLTKSFILGDREVFEVSLDHNENSSTSLTTAKALYEAWNQLKENIDQIDPNNNFFTDNTVVTLPLIETQFGQEESSKWDIQNWERSDGKVVYVQDVALKNYLKIPSTVFTKPGYYFLVVEVDRVDSGKLILYDNADTKLAEITEAGKYSYEIYITNSDVATLRFEASDVFTNEKIIVSFAGFYFVTDRIREYVRNVILAMSGGGSVEMADLEAAINELRTELLETIDDGDQVVVEQLKIHENDMNNPHGTTPEKIGAATANHTHTPASIGAATKNHTHTPEEVGAAAEDHTHTPASIGAADRTHRHSMNDLDIGEGDFDFDDRYALIDHNHDDVYASLYHNHDTVYSPIDHNHNSVYSKLTHNHDTVYSKLNHTHTPASIGAATADHTHTPASIGAADADHLHAIYSLTTHTHSLSSLGAASSTDLSAHINNKNNPHGVTTAIIGAAPDVHTHSISQVPTGNAGEICISTGDNRKGLFAPIMENCWIMRESSKADFIGSYDPTIISLYIDWLRRSYSIDDTDATNIPNPGTNYASPVEMTYFSPHATESNVLTLVNDAPTLKTFLCMVCPDTFINYKGHFWFTNTHTDPQTGAYVFVAAHYRDTEAEKDYTLSFVRYADLTNSDKTWYCVYNFGQEDEKIIADGTAHVAASTDGGFLTNTSVCLEIVRTEMSITARTSVCNVEDSVSVEDVEFITDSDIVVDLESDPDLDIFIGQGSLGYGFYKQHGGCNVFAYNFYDYVRPLYILNENGMYDVYRLSETNDTYVIDVNSTIYDDYIPGQFLYNSYAGTLFYLTPVHIQKVFPPARYDNG